MRLNIYEIILLALFGLVTSAAQNTASASINVLEISCAESKITKLYPVKNNQGAYEVGLGIVPLNITKFNLREGSVEVDFYLTIEYPLQHKVKDIKCVGDDASKVWRIFYNPDIEFMNIPNPEYVQGSHWLVTQGRFVYMTRAKGTARIDGNFKRYPFDSAIISFAASGEDDNTTLQLKPSEWYHPNLASLIEQMVSVKIPGWSLTRASFVNNEDVPMDGTGRWDVLTLALNLERKSGTVVVRSGLPLVLLYLVALFSLRLPTKFLDVRIGTQAAVLLALFAYSIYFIESIPPTDYLTFGDLTWITILTAIFLVIISEFVGHSDGARPPVLVLKRALSTISLLIVSLLIFAGAMLSAGY